MTLYGEALAALRDDQPHIAAQKSQRAAASEDPDTAALARFLHGNAQFARCLIAEKQARAAEAEPFAFDVAIRFARGARESWETAAMTRDDWPAARRNVERALLKIEDLKRQKAQRKDDRRSESSDPQVNLKRQPTPGEPEKKTAEPSGASGTTTKQDPEADNAVLSELSREQVLHLLEKLAQKEQEKRALRRKRRTAASTGAERDW